MATIPKLIDVLLSYLRYRIRSQDLRHPYLLRLTKVDYDYDVRRDTFIITVSGQCVGSEFYRHAAVSGTELRSLRPNDVENAIGQIGDLIIENTIQGAERLVAERIPMTFDVRERTRSPYVNALVEEVDRSIMSHLGSLGAGTLRKQVHGDWHTIGESPGFDVDVTETPFSLIPKKKKRPPRRIRFLKK